MKPIKLACLMIGSALTFKFLSDFFSANPGDAVDPSRMLFANRCSQCHNLDVAEEFDSYLPSKVLKTLERMQHKPNSGISSEDIQAIYAYLMYTFSTTHKQEIHEALNALPDDKRKEEQAKLDAILSQYPSRS